MHCLQAQYDSAFVDYRLGLPIITGGGKTGLCPEEVHDKAVRYTRRSFNAADKFREHTLRTRSLY